MSKFEDIVNAFAHNSDLMASFRASEQWFHQQYPDGGYPCSEIVLHAWMKLTPMQQAESLNDLFGAWFNQLLDIREWLRLDGEAMTDSTYLKHGDLEIIEDSLGFIDGEPEDALDETDICIPLGVAVRVINELKLLRRREEKS